MAQYYREILIKSLSAIYPKLKIKSSTLLQAYASFKMIGQRSDTNLCDEYLAFIEKEHPQKPHAVFAFNRNSSKTVEIITFINNLFNNQSVQNAFKDAWTVFSKTPSPIFFRLVIPDLVSNYSEFKKYWGNHRDVNILTIAEHIIRIRETYYKAFKAVPESESKATVNPIEQLYSYYCELEKNENIRLSKESFLDFYSLVNLHPLDFNLFALSKDARDKKSLFQLVDILNQRLDLSREQKLKICNELLDGRKPHELSTQYISNFAKEKDPKEREMMLRQAFNTVGTASPLLIVSAIKYLRPIALSAKTGSRLREENLAENDLSLECGLSYSLFASSAADIFYTKSKKCHVAILFPSPYFIRKWASDSLVKDIPADFVLLTSAEQALIQRAFTDSSYGESINEKHRFFNYQNWSSNIKDASDSI